MPTLPLLNGYRFFFYSNESGEPPPVHVEKDRHSAKYWLDSLTLARKHGFNARDLRQV